MKSCNTKRRKPKRKTFKLIKKKPTVAEEVSPSPPNFPSHWRPLFSPSVMHDAQRKDPQLTLSVSSHRDILWQRNNTSIKGKAADFFGILYRLAGK